jgi:hypothetical protein
MHDDSLTEWPADTTVCAPSAPSASSAAFTGRTRTNTCGHPRAQVQQAGGRGQCCQGLCVLAQVSRSNAHTPSTHIHTHLHAVALLRRVVVLCHDRHVIRAGHAGAVCCCCSAVQQVAALAQNGRAVGRCQPCARRAPAAAARPQAGLAVVGCRGFQAHKQQQVGAVRCAALVAQQAAAAPPPNRKTVVVPPHAPAEALPPLDLPLTSCFQGLS